MASSLSSILRPLCLLEHLSLDNETGLDPPPIISHHGISWAVLIENLAKIGYEEKNLHMAAYDRRLSFQNTEVATPPPLGGHKGANWCAKHIKAVMNIAPAFLGVPNTVTNIISIEGRDIAAIRAMAHGVLDSEILGLQMLKHFMRVCRTWDSGISLIPKGGETILGDLDWSPEEGFSCGLERSRSLESPVFVKNANNSEGRESFMIKESANFIISFSRLLALDIKELSHGGTLTKVNSSCQEVWTEYDEMSGESIRYVADNKAYTSRAVIDLLRVLAPEMMKRGEAHFSHGIADNLDNPKYNHYRYCSNPLEMKLPNAPEMEYMPRRATPEMDNGHQTPTTLASEAHRKQLTVDILIAASTVGLLVFAFLPLLGTAMSATVFLVLSCMDHRFNGYLNRNLESADSWSRTTPPPPSTT
ncbi:hypothetical protein CDL15_Pgr025144 [Punica granatum]|uniref:Uncharacterized protein n=1 Tax=Punica granatum TaxID=22663 RepID=A0A218W7V0_PUNGR|nr:hypothetical protein CDL15_Pgr025144 [Punica granatum]